MMMIVVGDVAMIVIKVTVVLVFVVWLNIIEGDFSACGAI